MPDLVACDLFYLSLVKKRSFGLLRKNNSTENFTATNNSLFFTLAAIWHCKCFSYSFGWES